MVRPAHRRHGLGGQRSWRGSEAVARARGRCASSTSTPSEGAGGATAVYTTLGYTLRGRPSRIIALDPDGTPAKKRHLLQRRWRRARESVYLRPNVSAEQQQDLFGLFRPQPGVHRVPPVARTTMPRLQGEPTPDAGPGEVIFQRSWARPALPLTLRRDGVAVATIRARQEREAVRFSSNNTATGWSAPASGNGTGHAAPSVDRSVRTCSGAAS